MEVVGTVMSVAQTIFAALQSSELKEAVSIFGYKSELEDLQRTVSTIQAVFQDAEKKKTLSYVELKLIEDLKDAVYEADDLLDEFVTLIEQKQLIKTDGRISKKMHSFISRTNPFGVAYKMSKGVKDIRKKLNAIVDNNRFSFVHNPEPIKMRRLETCSYVNEVDIIGRGEDLEKIVSMLLDSNVECDPSYISIVGIGGMGKTALAQLVFNDPRVKSVFPLRFWACVSDQDQKHLDVKDILGKILASMKLDEGTTLVEKQTKLQRELFGKRYLIVLDDVWTEKCEEWRCLAQYFVGGQSGSWIMVTTRSQRTAKIIGGKSGPVHELEGLSEVDSWCLFKRTAFGPEESNLPPDDDLIEFGRAIVDRCARVPLAIRVMGSFLYCQDKNMWQLVKETGLANIEKSEDGMMSILQLSYHHLESPLKCCFKYCTLFPKDYEIDKEMVTDLWIAQGYVVPLYEGQSVENAAEEYFSILVKRCFFQDIKRDGFGEIVSSKMHDLIHDVAQSVSGNEIFAANTDITNFNKKVRHFSIPVDNNRKPSLDNSHLRSYILVGDGNFMWKSVESSIVKPLISSCRYLRVLNLAGLKMRSLPNSLTTLLHLRYLDLSSNSYLEVLPSSISKLYNLQTLKLKECGNLQELPHDLSKLVKLRVLDIGGCIQLKYMPRDMKKLTCLNRLSNFIVGSEWSFVNWKQWFDGLEDLKALNGLKGILTVNIKWPKKIDNVITGDYIEKGDVLRSKEHLNNIRIEFERQDGDGRIMDEKGSVALMKDLHPPPNVMGLYIKGYNGTKMPEWASHLPNLVNLGLVCCIQLKEWGRGIVRRDSSSCNIVNVLQSLSCLPQLKSLRIVASPELRWIPLCPKLESLHLDGFNGRLVMGEVGHSHTLGHKIKDIEINNVIWLSSLPMEAFHCLERLIILSDDKLEKLGEVGDVFRSCSSSLRFLEIKNCSKLRSVLVGGLEYLSALEHLTFFHCENLKLSEDGDDTRITSLPYPSLLPSLHTLLYLDLPKLENLPNWMQFLTALQTLGFYSCGKLLFIPNWMPRLTSLRDLDFFGASESLERRCRKDPQGEDWPFVQHIPSITFRHSFVENLTLNSLQSQYFQMLISDEVRKYCSQFH